MYIYEKGITLMRNCVREKRMIKVEYKRIKIPYCSKISLLIFLRYRIKGFTDLSFGERNPNRGTINIQRSN